MTTKPEYAPRSRRHGAGGRLIHEDCLLWMRRQRADSVDLVFGSPPYEGQRTYDELEFEYTGDEWVSWALERYCECVRICRGLVAWVIEGTVRDYCYSASPFKLLAALHKRGICVRKPCVYYRHGIPGTGGPDWLRNDWEPIICASKGKLPYFDVSACGTRPKYHSPRTATNRNKTGARKRVVYRDPETTNPGNIIHCTVGKGHLGWNDAHENEAPFPEHLADFFVRSFCPIGGTVLDPFCGSGTTLAVAQRTGREAIGIDMRQSQLWLTETRLMGLTVAERKAGQQTLFDAR